MEKKVEEFLTRKGDGEGSDLVSQLTFPPHRPHHESSFFEYLILRGITVDRLEHDSFSCSFEVPPRLTDENGNLAVGAIAALVDEIGAAAIHLEGLAMDVSVDMSISYFSPANINAHIWTQDVEMPTKELPFHEACELESHKGVNHMLKDELEIVSRFLGNRGGYYGTNVVIQNKLTGEIVAEGRHSLFRKPASKM